MPPKFVTNFCFSPHGTANVFRIVEWWQHLYPTNHTLSDDLENMYQMVDRRASFAFLRKRCPQPIPVARLFYGDDATRIWFRGGLIHAHEPDVGVEGGVTSATCLRSCHGGKQGCPLATLLTIGAYHEVLAELQRDRPCFNITADADDTYSTLPLLRKWLLESAALDLRHFLNHSRCRTAHGKSVNLWEEPWALVHSFECLHGGRWRPSGARAGD